MNTFIDFLAQVNDDDKELVITINEVLMADGYKIEIGERKSGLYMSYSHPKTKRAFLHLFFLKRGLQCRIYTEGHKNYADFINKLSEEQEQRIAKARKCDNCTPSCTKGYGLTIRGNKYFTCRYYAFHLDLNAVNKPIIMDLIKLEKQAR
jgi:predicted N-acyltransferase